MFVCEVRVAEADVLADGSGKEEWVLQDDCEVTAEGDEVVLAQIDAVDQDGASSHVVETHHETGESGFACAGVANDGDGFTGLDGEGDIFQYPLYIRNRSGTFESAWV